MRFCFFGLFGCLFVLLFVCGGFGVLFCELFCWFFDVLFGLLLIFFLILCCFSLGIVLLFFKCFLFILVGLVDMVFVVDRFVGMFFGGIFVWLCDLLILL